MAAIRVGAEILRKSVCRSRFTLVVPNDGTVSTCKTLIVPHEGTVLIRKSPIMPNEGTVFCLLMFGE